MYAFHLIFVLSVCCCYGVSINDDDDDYVFEVVVV